MSERPAGTGVVVFVGPTLAVAEAQTLLPHADYRPPVAQGDIFSMLADGPPDAIGIVDGVFYQDLPVWHKEIIHALASGVAVYGAASMGALRAAECAQFGMVGVGEIFDAYARGELIDDDEVAVAHGDPESGWRPFTEPMVNLRATMRLAVGERRIPPELSRRFLDFAKRVWFPERTRQRLLEGCEAWAECDDDVAAVRRALDAAYVDQKRRDALTLLETLRERPAGKSAGRLSVEVTRSHVFDAFTERDRKVERSGTTMRLEEIARYVALHDPDYPRVYDRALDRMLVDMLAIAHGLDPSPDQVAEELRRIRARLRLSGDAALAEWLADNHVDEGWLRAHAEREARARMLRDWARIRMGKRLMVGPVLDELRLENRYAAATDGAASHHSMRRARGDEARPLDRLGEDGAGSAAASSVAADLVRDQMPAGSWRPDVPIDRFADEAGFAGVADLLDELAAVRSVRDRARAQLAALGSIFAEGVR